MTPKDFAHLTWGQIPEETKQDLALSRYLDHCERCKVAPLADHIISLPPTYLIRTKSEHSRERGAYLKKHGQSASK